MYLLGVPRLVRLLLRLFLLVLGGALLFQASPRLLALAARLGFLSHVDSVRAHPLVDQDGHGCAVGIRTTRMVGHRDGGDYIVATDGATVKPVPGAKTTNRW